MKIIRYEDKQFYYFWKPAGVPSTFWENKSFLDFLSESNQTDVKWIFLYLNDMFWSEDEYWLLNRLDNDTSWLLYFAKTPLFKKRYIEAQKDWKLAKYYIADVYGKFDDNVEKISYPIWHHKFSKDRMVVFSGTKQTSKTHVNKLIKANTYVDVLYYDEVKNFTTLSIMIQKGIRHQIRVHLSSIWFPIVWEKIYIKQPKTDILHLYSIWLKIL